MIKKARPVLQELKSNITAYILRQVNYKRSKEPIITQKEEFQFPQASTNNASHIQ